MDEDVQASNAIVAAVGFYAAALNRARESGAELEKRVEAAEKEAKGFAKLYDDLLSTAYRAVNPLPETPEARAAVAQIMALEQARRERQK